MSHIALVVPSFVWHGCAQSWLEMRLTCYDRVHDMRSSNQNVTPDERVTNINTHVDSHTHRKIYTHTRIHTYTFHAHVRRCIHTHILIP